MKKSPDYENDLASIRNLMERSTKFISLSGMSGIMAGVFALIGAVVAYYLVYYPHSPFGYRFYYVNETEIVWKLALTAILVLAASLFSGYWFTQKKAKKKNLKIWDKTSKNLFINLSIPLITGGLFILALILREHYIIVAPASLIFYGLALVNCSHYTYGDIRVLGYFQIALGLVAAIIPGYGLIFWALGFGVMHILYGFLMYRKYDLEK